MLGNQVGTSMIVDSIMVVLFVIYLLVARRRPASTQVATSTTSA